jgi:hypothetical protein
MSLDRFCIACGKDFDGNQVHFSLGYMEQWFDEHDCVGVGRAEEVAPFCSAACCNKALRVLRDADLCLSDDIVERPRRRR